MPVKMNKKDSIIREKPRSHRDLLTQLKSLVSTSGNEKRFLIDYVKLNIDAVGRTTIYDALHGRKIGLKLEGLLDRIKVEQDLKTAHRVEEFEAIDPLTTVKIKVRNSKGVESDPPRLLKQQRKVSILKGARAAKFVDVEADQSDGSQQAETSDIVVPKVRKPRISHSKYALTRTVPQYIKQLKSLISGCGSERKFFSQYERFNVAGAVRSSVYNAVHDGKMGAGLAIMLDGILGSAPDVKVKGVGRKVLTPAEDGGVGADYGD